MYYGRRIFLFAPAVALRFRSSLGEYIVSESSRLQGALAFASP